MTPQSPFKCTEEIHVGTFSFGCTVGVMRCDACGKRVDATKMQVSFKDALLNTKIAIRIEKLKKACKA